jgi:hypothetical protein
MTHVYQDDSGQATAISVPPQWVSERNSARRLFFRQLQKQLSNLQMYRALPGVWRMPMTSVNEPTGSEAS